MIQGKIIRETDGRVVSFELTGHAEAGPFGSDIVCAATSALTINAVNGVEALAGFTPLVETDEQNGGYLRFETVEDITQEQSNIAQIILENLVLGLTNIEEQYSEYIKVQTYTKH